MKKPKSTTRRPRRPSRKSNRTLLAFDRKVAEQRSAAPCGVDEAGRGPLAGPVVVCACIVKDDSFESRIDDSKKLSPEQREAAYAEILKKCILSLSVVDETRIDEINIYRATMEAVKEAVAALREKPAYVLMDGPVCPDVGCPGEGVIDGDAKSFSIACASIAAKVTRDRIMQTYHERWPEYGFDRHKGYGTPEHLEALKKHGPCPIHRKSFELGVRPAEFGGLSPRVLDAVGDPGD